MLPRKTRRQTELRQPIRLAHEEPKPVIGAMDILASLAMTNECVKGVARRCSAAMDGKASVAGIESQGEVVGPSIEPSAPGDILHSLVKLLNRVAIDIEQEEAEIDQVGVSLVLDLLDDSSDMRTGKFGEDTFGRSGAGNALSTHGHRGVQIEREIIRDHGHAGFVFKPEILAQMITKDRQLVGPMHTFSITNPPVDIA